MPKGAAMPFIERVAARAYSRATEIVDRVRAAILNLFPEDLRQHVRTNTVRTEGYGQIPIVIVNAVISGKRVARKTFHHLIGQMSQADRDWLSVSLDRRLDERCVLFLRVDKQEAYIGSIRLARGPDVISVRVHIREYPRCDQEKVMRFLRETIRSVGQE
ncbi:MAG TPA: hypothetical protein ENG31_00475 [Candidatus Thorarchaeota archaeon]|nr:hypothetical protein [Candidatus Thorarchaeota archaeon]